MSLVFTGAGNNTGTSGAGLSANTATSFAVGDFLVVLLAYDNSGGGGADPISGQISAAPSVGALGASVSAQTGHNDPGAASAGVAARCVVWPVTTAIPNGTNVTVTWTGSVVYRAMAFMKVSTDLPTYGVVAFSANSGAAGTNAVASAGPSLTTPTIPYTPGSNLYGGVLCWGAYEYGGVSFTGDTDTLNGSWSAIYGVNVGSALSGMSAYFQSKVPTSGSAQTWNPTGTSSDWILGAICFSEQLQPIMDQRAYRIYADGTEAGATALAAQNTAPNVNLGSGDANVLVRVALQNSAPGALAPATDDWQLQWEKNTSGSWTNITTGGTTVVAYNSANLTDQGATSNLLTGATGTFTSGKVSEDGLADNSSMGGNGNTEHLYSVTLKKADLADGDTLRFRVLRNGAVLNTYTQYPTVTVTVPPPAALNITGFQFFLDDADPNTSTQAAFANSSLPVSDAVVHYIVRMQVSNTDASQSHSGALDLEARKNSGAWFRPSVSQFNGFQITSSAFITTTAVLTAARIGGGIGTYVNGQAVESADQATVTIGPGQYTEMAFVITTDAANMTYGDVFEFRLTRGGVTTAITYTQTPVMSVISTRLYFGNQTAGLPGIHRGTNSTKLNGTASGWTVMALNPSVGSAQTTVTATTVAGPTNGIEVASGGFPVEWISPPLAQAVTISGAVYANLWAGESAAAVNAQVQFILERMDSTGAIISTICQSAQGGEMGPSPIAMAFNLTPTSTNMLQGDRFRCRIFADDAVSLTMAAGTMTFSYGAGSTGGATGDSYISFTEIFNYMTDEPAGSIMYLTDTAGPAVGAATEKEMWTARGSGVVTAIKTATPGWTAPVQWTVSAGGAAIEWYSKPVQAFTLDGLVELNLRARNASPDSSSLAVEIAITNMDGSGAVVWAAASLVDTVSPGGVLGGGFANGALGTGEYAVRAWLAGPPTALTDGKRLRLRVLQDDVSDASSGGNSLTFYYNGTTVAASGDTWIQLPQTVTEYIPSPITQASYRIYDDGTETGAVALAAQDTAAQGDITNGDGIGQLRVRLQATTAVAVGATDDWQLQWEKNASGSWANVVSPPTGYDSSNVNVNTDLAGTGPDEVNRVAQSFTGDGKSLTRVGFWLSRTGTGAGTAVAVVYAHSGTFGTSSVPTGAALATSTTVLTASTLSTTPAWVYFDFDGSFTPGNGTSYCLALVGSGQSAANPIKVGIDTTSPTAPGNYSSYANAAWSAAGGTDLAYVMYTGGSGASTVVGFASTNTTDGAVTTNRLGAGSGSFVAGKISETGLVTDLGWTASNYTELLFPLAIKKADVVAGDVLRFRVLRNGSTSGMTYTAVPTVNVYQGVIDRPATINDNWGTWTATAAAQPINSNITITGFRFFNDDAGTATSTAIAADNTNISLLDADKTMQFRAQIVNTASGLVDIPYYLQRNINGGTWAYTSASTAILSVDSPHYGNGSAVTTSRIGGGVGTFGQGEATDFNAASPPVPANGYTEGVWSIKLIAADVAPGDVIGLRFTFASGALVQMAVTPTITVTANVVSATIADNWGGWNAVGVATVGHPATITQSWGVWNAVAIATRDTKAVIASDWGTWTATAAGSILVGGKNVTDWSLPAQATTFAPTNVAATITQSWGTWNAVGVATRITTGTVTENWGGWNATAIATRNTKAIINDSWGVWNAVAVATVNRKGLIDSGWGNWTAVAVAVRTHFATVTTTNWSPWNATAIAVINHPATVTQSWGTWNAVAIASVSPQKFGTIADNWGTLTGVAVATRNTKAIVNDSWGVWNATAVATRIVTSTITENWGGWVATSIAAVGRAATITQSWGSWTAIAQAQPIGRNAIVNDNWGTWTGVAIGGIHPGWEIPHDVVATATGKNTIQVTWAPVTKATGFDVLRDGVVIATDHPASPYNDSGLAANTLYSYRVIAVDAMTLATRVLGEASARFDYSAYSDTANMRDVNNNWGPLTTTAYAGITRTFTPTGLRHTGSSASYVYQHQFASLPGPVVCGPNGLSSIHVVRWDTARGTVQPDMTSLEFYSADGGFFVKSRWYLRSTTNPLELVTQYLDDLMPGRSLVSLENSNVPPNHEVTDLGVFLTMAVHDTPNMQSHLWIVPPAGAPTKFTTAMNAPPPLFASTPQVLTGIWMRTGFNLGTIDLTVIETDMWNRALTSTEMDALVTHFRAGG